MNIQDTGFGDTELEQKAKWLFNHKIAPTLTQADIGKYLTIDTDTNEWEMGTNDIEVAMEAYRKNPDGQSRFGVRIGYQASGYIPGGIPAMRRSIIGYEVKVCWKPPF